MCFKQMEQQPYKSSNKRIAKNTLYMYFRMAILMLVSLYTSRVVLANLGIDDYGIYNVVGALIVSFTFIKGPLSSATQRFLNYEMGVKTNGKPNLVFNVSLYVYIVIALLIVLILEIGGQWFLNNEMNIPPGRMSATQFTFQISLISLLFSFARVPYDALIISNERLSFYALLSLLEVTLKLLNAFSLSYFMVDKLELYALNHLAIDIILTLTFVIYTKRKIPEFKFTGEWDGKLAGSLLKFTGWGLFGSFSGMTADQGVNIVLNIFCGVVVNASMGIAQQINNAVCGLASNFQTAFRPQIMKSYASGDWQDMNTLIERTSKFSFLLIFLIAFPFCLNCEFILDLWLKEWPQLARDFCILFMGYSLINVLGAPFWMAIYATGNIRNYQLLYSCISLLNIVFSYILLLFGVSPCSVLVVKILLEVAILTTRIELVKRYVHFVPSIYSRKVLLPCTSVLLISCIVVIPLCFLIDEGWIRLIVTLLLFISLYPLLIYYICLSSSEKKYVSEKLSMITNKN